MRTARCTLVASLVVIASLPSASGAEDEVKIVRRVLSWPSEQGPLYDGLHQTRLSEDRLDEQLQLIAYGDGRLVLTSSVTASNGRMEQMLADEGSDWWVRLTIDTNVTGQDLHEFFQKAYAADPGSQRLSLSTSDGFDLRTEMPLNGIPPVENLLVAELRRQGVAEDISRSIPPQVARAAVFLASSLAEVPTAVSPGIVGGRANVPLLELLSAVLVESAGASQPPPTPMLLETIQRERVGPDDEWLERFVPEVSGRADPR